MLPVIPEPTHRYLPGPALRSKLNEQLSGIISRMNELHETIKNEAETSIPLNFVRFRFPFGFRDFSKLPINHSGTKINYLKGKVSLIKKRKIIMKNASMTKTGILTSLFVLLSWIVSGQNLVEKDGIYYSGNKRYSGTYTENFSNGKIKTQISFRKGMKYGKMRLFFENGQINEIRSYRKNLMDGTWTTWNEAGCRIAIANYQKGEKHGDWVIWNERGKIIYLLHYKKGKKSGLWKMYDQEGNFINQRYYK